jgi:hypothetical protein
VRDTEGSAARLAELLRLCVLQSLAVIVGIDNPLARKDNYRIQFQDGSERNTSQDRISPA